MVDKFVCYGWMNDCTIFFSAFLSGLRLFLLESYEMSLEVLVSSLRRLTYQLSFLS